MATETRRCYMDGCVATWKHWHGFLPGGYDNPADPTGVPILFEGDDPEPGAIRDYNGAVLTPHVTVRLNAMRCPVCGHRMDDLQGCDDCAADRAETDMNREGDPAFNGTFDRW